MLSLKHNWEKAVSEKECQLFREDKKYYLLHICQDGAAVDFPGFLFVKVSCTLTEADIFLQISGQRECIKTLAYTYSYSKLHGSKEAMANIEC